MSSGSLHDFSIILPTPSGPGGAGGTTGGRIDAINANYWCWPAAAAGGGGGSGRESSSNMWEWEEAGSRSADC